MPDSLRSRRSFLHTSAALGLGYCFRDSLLAQSSQLHPAQTMHARPPAPPKVPLLNALELAPFVDPLPIPAPAEPVSVSGAARYRITMRQIEAQMHRDMKPTRLWSYGSHACGPMLEAHSGEPIEVEWVNELPRRHFLPIDHTLHGCGAGVPEVRATVHLHGGRNRTRDDGYPDDWYGPGHSRVCHYANPQDATMLWYHDHAMGINRLNVYAGLFGPYLLRDKQEAALELPRGEYEVPLLLYDRNFTLNSELYYPVSWNPAKPWVPECFGDAMVINGKIRPYFNVEPRLYRFRVLNAANGRFFSLSLSHGQLTQIGSDQGLLASPVIHTRPLVLAPAERMDLLIDFSQMRGQRVHLQNGALGILEFRVSNGAAHKPRPLPRTLRNIERLQESSVVQTRQVTLHEYDDDYARSMVMLLNRKRWHEPVSERATLNSTEIWEFVNLTEDTHPMHMHLVRFQVLDRRPFDTFSFLIQKQLHFTGALQRPALNEMGWKDVVQCSPAMITRVIVRFEGYTGRYLYHCHILEHAANDMMRPYEVIA